MQGTAVGRRLEPRYLCAGRRSSQGCDRPLIRAEVVETQWVEFVGDFKPEAQIREEILRRLAGPAAAEAKETARKRTALEERLRRLRDLYELGDLDRLDYLARREAMQAESAALGAWVSNRVHPGAVLASRLEASQRARLAGGAFAVRSAPGVGTRIEACIPYEQALDEARLVSRPSTTSGPSAAPEGLIRVLIVDDHEVVREGIRKMLERVDDFFVVGEAADGEEAIEEIQPLSPDVVLLDLELPRLNGVETLARLRERPRVRLRPGRRFPSRASRLA